MCSKIIFVVASLCVVNASVVTVNVYDDVENDAVSLQTLRDCNYQACEQLCRRLGFTGGVCANGRCKCDINRKDAGTEAPASFMDSAEPEALKRCNNRACHQSCRRFGYAGGICVNGRCKCDLNRNVDVALEPQSSFIDSAEPETLRSCNNRVCHQRCRRTGFTGGVCADGRCKCDINRNSDVSEQPASVLDSAEPQPLESCNNQECDQRCRRLAFTGGVCVNGRCKCDINRNVPEVAESLSEQTNSLPRDCNYRECDQRCRRLGFTGGACANGRCKCDINRNGDVSEASASFLDSTEPQPLEGCNNQECDQRCRRLAFTGGVCVNGWCKCDINTRKGPALVNDVNGKEEEQSNEVSPTDEDELHSNSLRSCNTVNCNEMCHRLNYVGGMCRGNVCQCY